RRDGQGGQRGAGRLRAGGARRGERGAGRQRHRGQGRPRRAAGQGGGVVAELLPGLAGGGDRREGWPGAGQGGPGGPAGGRLRGVGEGGQGSGDRAGGVAVVELDRRAAGRQGGQRQTAALAAGAGAERGGASRADAVTLTFEGRQGRGRVEWLRAVPLGE